MKIFEAIQTLFNANISKVAFYLKTYLIGKGGGGKERTGSILFVAAVRHYFIRKR